MGLSLGAVFLSLLAAMLEPAAPLAPGATIERDLAGGKRDSFILEVADRPLLLTVEQRGINVALDAKPPGGHSAGASNQAGEREALESLLLPSSAPGPWHIDVIALETGVPPGRYRLRVEELPEGSPDERRRVRAESLLSDMGRLRKLGDGDSKRRLLVLGQEASSGWQALGLTREEARTLYMMAEAHRALGEARQALPLYEKTLALESAAGDAAGHAASSHTLTAMGLARWSLGEHEEALVLLDRALEIQRRLGAAYDEAVTLCNICLVRHSRGEWRESIPCYEQALRLLQAVQAPDSEAFTRVNLAGVYDLLGEPLRARDEYKEALVRMRSLGDRRGELQVINNLAVVLAGMGETSEAILLYEQALDLSRGLGEQGWEGRALYNRGSVYLGLGEPARAAADFEESLSLRRKVGDRRGETLTLNALGLHGQALALAREAGDRNLEAASLVAQGDPASLDQAAELYRVLGSRRGLAGALSRKGKASLLSGRPEEALPFLREALTLRREIEDRAGQAETLVLMSQAERRLGRAGAALDPVEEAVELIESLRADVIVPDLRSTFLASRQQAFELAVDLRMELHRGAPEAGHAAAALALSERARARTLLDLLGEARADVRQGIDPQLREEERTVAARLAAKARRRIELLGGPPGPPATLATLATLGDAARKESSARELRETLAESDRLEAAIRQRNPRYAALLHPEPLSAAAIQELLDPETLLLEYALGAERSFLWAVSPAKVESFELPGRAEVEALARQVYEGLRALDAGDPGAQAGEATSRQRLSRILLGPVADRLADRRLIVVADGALLYIPFAALPVPDDPGAALLVERHEIVVLPSASVLALRRQEPPAGEMSIAILADPVFDDRDPRVRRASTEGAVAATGGPIPARSGLSLSRLAGSGLEAKAIEDLLPPGRAWVALGFQASRATAFGGELARHRIVHFATHGVIDAETPELSGLVLSLVDEAGRPQEGFLGLSDIYNLDLRSDLVVLSGCETALGREMRGEGLVGLTRGFLYAGAARVLASLWQVQDRPSKELMERFYRALLLDRLPPAAALRSAQLSLLRERRWRDPFYWGAFVLQGDWR